MARTGPAQKAQAAGLALRERLHLARRRRRLRRARTVLELGAWSAGAIALVAVITAAALAR